MRKISIIIIFFLTATFGFSDAGQISEYHLKAVMFEQFARFVEWPERNLKSSDEFIICVLGDHHFDNILDNIYKKNKIKNRKVKIIFAKDYKKIPDCHLLFICESEKAYTSEIITSLKDKPVLTVGDSKGYARKGVHINIFLKNRRPRFHICIDAVKDSGLLMDHLLLRLGKIVARSKD